MINIKRTVHLVAASALAVKVFYNEIMVAINSVDTSISQSPQPSFAAPDWVAPKEDPFCASSYCSYMDSAYPLNETPITDFGVKDCDMKLNKSDNDVVANISFPLSVQQLSILGAERKFFIPEPICPLNGSEILYPEPGMCEPRSIPGSVPEALCPLNGSGILYPEPGMCEPRSIPGSVPEAVCPLNGSGILYSEPGMCEPRSIPGSVPEALCPLNGSGILYPEPGMCEPRSIPGSVPEAVCPLNGSGILYPELGMCEPRSIPGSVPESSKNLLLADIVTCFEQFVLDTVAPWGRFMINLLSEYLPQSALVSDENIDLRPSVKDLLKRTFSYPLCAAYVCNINETVHDLEICEAPLLSEWIGLANFSISSAQPTCPINGSVVPALEFGVCQAPLWIDSSKHFIKVQPTCPSNGSVVPALEFGVCQAPLLSAWTGDFIKVQPTCPCNASATPALELGVCAVLDNQVASYWFLYVMIFPTFLITICLALCHKLESVLKESSCPSDGIFEHGFFPAPLWIDSSNHVNESRPTCPSNQNATPAFELGVCAVQAISFIPNFLTTIFLALFHKLKSFVKESVFRLICVILYNSLVLFNELKSNLEEIGYGSNDAGNDQKELQDEFNAPPSDAVNEEDEMHDDFNAPPSGVGGPEILDLDLIKYASQFEKGKQYREQFALDRRTLVELKTGSHLLVKSLFHQLKGLKIRGEPEIKHTLSQLFVIDAGGEKESQAAEYAFLSGILGLASTSDPETFEKMDMLFRYLIERVFNLILSDRIKMEKPFSWVKRDLHADDLPVLWDLFILVNLKFALADCTKSSRMGQTFNQWIQDRPDFTARDEQQVNAVENASSIHLPGEAEQVHSPENTSSSPLTGEEEQVDAVENSNSSPLPIKKPATVIIAQEDDDDDDDEVEDWNSDFDGGANFSNLHANPRTADGDEEGEKVDTGSSEAAGPALTLKIPDSTDDGELDWDVDL